MAERSRAGRGRWLALVSFALLAVLALLHGLQGAPLQARPAATDAPALSAQLTPPATIRVIHVVENTKWSDWPVGEVRTFDFEEYVRHVVRYEVYCSWPMETLKAQAVAARTYAWNKILQRVGQPWDVTDWTSDQAFGPESCTPSPCERSCAAVDATRGQYVAYSGQPILAQYSAENSDPTLDATNVPYLRGIEDPVGFAWVRKGHGHGLSQWGVQRWAEIYNWDYQKILMHYYTGVSVELPAGAGPDTAPPLGSVVLPWNNWYFTGSRILVRANASDALSGVARADFVARWPSGATAGLGSDGNAAGGWTAAWDVSVVADQPIGAPMVLSMTVRDVVGNAMGGVAPVVIGLDRSPPTVTAAIDGSYAGGPTVTLRLGAGDVGSGLAGVSLSNNWVWEGESLSLSTGTVVSDSAALNGSAWQARAGVDAPGNTSGPRVTTLPAGRYRAYFRLKATGVLTTAVIARLDVITSTATMTGCIGLHDVRGGDMRAAGEYQEVAVEFDYTTAGQQLQFRVHFPGVADLFFDRVIIVSYPQTFAELVAWPIGDGPLPRTVQVKSVDMAGNVSADAVVIVGGPPLTPTRTPPTASTTALPTATPSATKTSATPSATATRRLTPLPAGAFVPLIVAESAPPATPTVTASR